MTPADVRDRAAERAAQQSYAAAYDRHAERAQMFRQFKRPLHERAASAAALIALRAFRAECRPEDRR